MLTCTQASMSTENSILTETVINELAARTSIWHKFVRPKRDNLVRTSNHHNWQIPTANRVIHRVPCTSVQLAVLSHVLIVYEESKDSQLDE